LATGYGGNGSSLSFYQDLDYYGEVVPTCSATYKAYIIATSGIQNGTYEVVSYIADFFQGTVSLKLPVLLWCGT